LSEEEFAELMEHLQRHFVFEPRREQSIEVDPRTVALDGYAKLSKLYALGFNRISLGIQDLDVEVQEAILRRQSRQVSLETLQEVKQRGFEGVNVDLVYGLPHQTVASFTKTAEVIASHLPDRIALFSYAHVPWLKEHQKAIDPSSFPTPSEKLAIYIEARKVFLDAGYLQIGMDHFCLPSDAMAIHYQNRTLTRNFQGYTPHLADDLVGLGLSSIGYIQGAYFQNTKNLQEYQDTIRQGKLPVTVGYVLSQEDLLRRTIIIRLMCEFELDRREIEEMFQIPSFDCHFAPELRKLSVWEKEGLVTLEGTKIQATELGRLFVRWIASSFDQYEAAVVGSKAI
jgi:oxygen-independent coproporphyrinogen-3 oxidase